VTPRPAPTLAGIRAPIRAPIRTTFLAAALTATMAATPGFPGPRADDPVSRLKALEDRIEATRDQESALKTQESQAAQEFQRLQSVLVLAARTAREREAALAAVEGEVARISDAYASHRYALAARNSEVAAILAALARIARVPAATALKAETSSVDAIRGAMLLRAVLPEIDARAAGLRRDLAVYTATVDRLKAEKAALAEEKAAIEGERSRLAALLAERRELRARLTAEQDALRAEIEGLLRQARGLRELLERIAAERQRTDALARAYHPPDRAPLDRAPLDRAPLDRALADMGLADIRFPYPVFGEVVRRFGDPTESGHPSVGLVLATLPEGAVVAPHGGRVVYAGAFRGYGQLLILEIAEGYHILLSGLSRIDVETGQSVLVGEPIGVMGETGSGLTSLYFELRREGQPIDPLPWLADRNTKVSG